MASTSLTAAKADLYALLTSNTTTGAPAATLTAVARVYNHEPLPGDLFKPISVTITSAGMNASEFMLEVRIYAADATQQITQANLDLAIAQVDARIGTSAQFGPSDWEIQWAADISAWVAVSRITTGRQDNM